MIIRDELPFRVVEGEGFKDYSRLLEPRFVIPSRITVRRDCMKLFMENKKLLKNHLKNEHLCLTTDTWSVTPQNRGSVDNPSTRGILVDVG